MFNGIVETTGTVTAMSIADGCKHFTIMPAISFTDLAIGDSIAVNGVCLTITHFSGTAFHVTAVPETLRLTNLNQLTVESLVNLERSLTMATRMGGHYVQGHVDGIGKILSIEPDQSSAWQVKISLPPALAKYVVAKGYITLDGMSITVIEAHTEWFTITLIPHTQAVTIAKHYTPGQFMNIEVDIMGKYIEKLLEVRTHANAN